MSTLKVNTIQTASGVDQYLAKAWVNFNGTGTVAIRASGNVSSITDNGTGDYTVNFTNAMTDANYAPSHAMSTLSLPSPTSIIQVQTTSSYRFTLQGVSSGASTVADATVATCVIHR